MAFSIPNSSVAFLVPGDLQAGERSRVVNSVRYFGSFKKPLKRVSRDPIEARVYQPGDPVRMIDWQAYARTDQLLVRQRRDEAGIGVRFVTTIGPTMTWPGPNIHEIIGQPVASKLELAYRIQCSLAYDHLRRGDRVEFVGIEPPIGRKCLTWVPRSATDIVDYFNQLQARKFEPEVFKSLASESTLDLLQSVELSFIASDFLEHEQARALCQRASRALVLHVFSCLERDPQWLSDRWTYFDEGHAKEYETQDLIDTLQSQTTQWSARVRDQLRPGDTYLAIDEMTSYGILMSFIEDALRDRVRGGK